jgi:hypothetical protein
MKFDTSTGAQEFVYPDDHPEVGEFGCYLWEQKLTPRSYLLVGILEGSKRRKSSVENRWPQHSRAGLHSNWNRQGRRLVLV